jgi:nucleoside-diphosphate-sugar epimerase
MTGKETILVTGSGGFIGGWIAETLFLSRAANVRAGIRNWSSGARLSRFPLEIVLCDVMDKESITQAMAGVTCVIHCAIGARDVIVQGTENMLKAALASGIRRFVHMSTCEVYGQANGQINEMSPYQYTGSPYGDAKIDAEKLCWEYIKKGLAVTILRPPIVYGPFSTDWTLKLARRLQSGNWGTFKEYGDGVCNLVYIADLIAGILLAANHEYAVGEAFNLGGPETITWNQYFTRFNAALGLPELGTIKPQEARLRTTLLEPVRSVAKFALAHLRTPLRRISQRFRHARLTMQSAERSLTTSPRSAELDLYNRNAVYQTSKAQAVLGYKPRFDIDSGLRLSVLWLDHLGLLYREDELRDVQ